MVSLIKRLPWLGHSRAQVVLLQGSSREDVSTIFSGPEADGRKIELVSLFETRFSFTITF
jgi:hypothetical protein